MRDGPTYAQKFYNVALKPGSQQPDEYRREFIINVLLSGLIVVSSLALIGSLITFTEHQNTNGAQSLIITALFLTGLIGGHRAVRSNHVTVVSYALVVALGLAATQLMFHWSFELPQVLLAFSLTIVVASVLLTARAGLLFAAGFAVLIVLCGFLQVEHYLPANTAWRQKPFVLIDAIGYALIFSIIGLVSWLSNREIDRSLTRARLSEAALLAERDNLEIKVVERTKQLERSQLARTMELQRFAVFGKVSAGLVHELANPLMAATINLDQFKATDNAEILQRVRQNLQHLESYLIAARKQLQSSSTVESFSVGQELQHVVSLVQPVANKANVQLEMPSEVRIRIYGDPIKFSQLVGNLLVNAIEAYTTKPSTDQNIVNLSIKRVKRGVEIVVQDYGCGISPKQMKHIFEPFYTSKPSTTLHVGMGIGLSLVKQFVEEDFRGTLQVTSSAANGTRFTALLVGAKKQP